MTTYRVFKVGSNDCVEIKGHSGYAQNGHDIVCAAISTAAILTNNLIERLNLGYNVLDIVCEEGYFRLQINSNDKTTKAIFDNLVETLHELKDEYPRYLKFKN